MTLSFVKNKTKRRFLWLSQHDGVRKQNFYQKIIANLKNRIFVLSAVKLRHCGSEATVFDSFDCSYNRPENFFENFCFWLFEI